MQFAINYSPQAQSAIEAGNLHIDRYKLPDWDDLIAQARAYADVYVHFPLHAGRGQDQTIHAERFERLRQQTRTPFINTHIAPDASLIGIAYDDESPQATERLYSATMRDIESLIARWGAEHLIIENAPTSPQDPWHIPLVAVRPGFITRIIEASGAGFLLDTAHAWIASYTLGMGWRDYLDALPVQHLRELHITGTQAIAQDDPDAPAIYHDHFAMRPADWMSAEYALERIGAGDWARPWMVALEYGGVGTLFEWRSEQHIIARDGARLARLCHQIAT